MIRKGKGRSARRSTWGALNFSFHPSNSRPACGRVSGLILSLLINQPLPTRDGFVKWRPRYSGSRLSSRPQHRRKFHGSFTKFPTKRTSFWLSSYLPHPNEISWKVLASNAPNAASVAHKATLAAHSAANPRNHMELTWLSLSHPCNFGNLWKLNPPPMAEGTVI